MAETYQVKQGDCIYSIAFDKGLFADTIWNHPNNKDLKDKRKDPNVLLPGDMVYIPDKRLREYSEATNQVYKYKLKNTPKPFRIRLMNIEKPVKDTQYLLSIDGVEQPPGKTDGDGWLKCSIPSNAKRAKLKLEGDIEFDLHLGEMDPVDETYGVQRRLRNLGFFDGSPSGNLDEKTKSAIAAFQLSQGMEGTGELSSDVRDRLKAVVGE